MAEIIKKEDMNIVIVGHVDHGKSTLMGRLLADTDSLPKGKLDQVKENCRRNSKPFEYAFLLDALKDEQAQGITIDTARCFFKTKKRDYIILDAPGHIEFLKNMITGAARAQAALLVIDAKEGVQENSRRHGYMLSMLGIKQVAVVINKMDLVDYSQEIFEAVKEEYLKFLKQINIEPKFVLPISAFEGDNIVSLSNKMPWYNGMCILEVLDNFECEKEHSEQLFRMPVQDVYKFTKDGDDRRIVAGTIDTGSIKIGEEVVFYPSGKRSHIKSIEAFNTSKKEVATAGMAIGFTLKEQIYITRGELMTIASEKKPMVASKIAVNIFWLGKKSMIKNKKYLLKVGCQKVTVRLEEITNIINSSNLDTIKKDFIACNEVAECILKTEKPIAFDLVQDIANTSRFVIVDGYEISGGGIIFNSVEDEHTDIRDRVLMRNYKWEPSSISKERRSEQYSQKPILILITGEKKIGKKDLAKAFEKELITSGRFAYYIGIGSVLYGVDSDIKLLQQNSNHDEHIRRFAEVINLLLNAGLIVIATATNITQNDINIMKTVIEDSIDVVWVGNEVKTDVEIDLNIKKIDSEDNIGKLKEILKRNKAVFSV